MAQAVIGLSRDNITAATASPEFRLGTVGGYDDPTLGYQEFVYGRANGAVTGLGYVCVEETGFDFAMINVTKTTPGTAGFGSRVGVAQAVMADNQYGWFQVFGKGSVRTLASAAKGTRLNTTATDGALDDDATGGSEAVFGVVLGTATGASAATNADAILVYPTVGTTL
jgi:hypothetical protein